MLLLTFPSGSFPAGTVLGWTESPEGGKQEHAKFSQHMCFGVPTQPVGMDARQVNRHANLAKHPCNTRVILFSPRPSARVAATTPARILHLTSVLHGTLVPHPARGDRYPLLWRGWADSSCTLRYSDIPSSSSLDRPASASRSQEGKVGRMVTRISYFSTMPKALWRSMPRS